ncbi:hypothetical protein KSP40_PGU008183 [Platanthera guangdongensis]|uniref:AT-hook motif nuclear-localized protein n=1 Tax=Platanthera guangdongensis TaxID=2320717 RepID=A0ABR2LRE0_9ASPA
MRPEGVFSMGEPMKKKRGRPRKYGPDGSMSLALCSTTTSTSECNNNNASMSESTAKRRGRPPGSRKKQQLDALVHQCYLDWEKEIAYIPIFQPIGTVRTLMVATHPNIENSTKIKKNFGKEEPGTCGLLEAASRRR